MQCNGGVCSTPLSSLAAMTGIAGDLNCITLTRHRAATIGGSVPTLFKQQAMYSHTSHTADNVDVTSVHQLADVRAQLDRHAVPDPVDWHLACVGSRWTKRALTAAGFDHYRRSPASDASDTLYDYPWQSVFSVAEIHGSSSREQQQQGERRPRQRQRHR